MAKYLDLDLGGKEFHEVPENHPLRELIMAETVLPEHYSQPSAFLAMLYRRLTLDRVKGQDEAVFHVVKAVRDHACAIHDPHYHYLKTNPLIVGPTGSGKSYSVMQAAKLVGLPTVVFPMAEATPKGIVGKLKLPNALELLVDNISPTNEDLVRHMPALVAANRFPQEQGQLIIDTGSFETVGDEERAIAQVATAVYMAERGIIFLDEIDKIAYKGDGHNSIITHKMLQNELLSYLGGKPVQFEADGDVHVAQKYHGHTIHTGSILFFLAGAFSEIPEVADGGSVDVDMIRTYGIKPELLGRTGAPIVLRPLSEKNLVSIAQESEDEQTKLTIEEKLLADIQHDFPHAVLSSDVIPYLAKRAHGRGLGARGMTSEAATASGRLLKKLFYEYGVGHKEQIVIDAEYISQIL